MDNEIFYIQIKCGEKIKNAKTQNFDHFAMSGLIYSSRSMPREKFMLIKEKVEKLISEEMDKA